VGPIPREVARLTQLEYINLHSNRLTGPIDVFSNLTKLTYLKLNNNLLTGKIPAAYGNLTQLKLLSIGQNPLSGNLPDLSNLKQLVRA
jgi:Leucine-rich repeat (LRR) protein